MTLALVIPVRNDQRNLDRLLDQAATLGVFDQVVVIDDASDVPVSVPRDAIGPRRCPVTVLRQDRQRGAGAARNLGLTAVQTDHMIFFDSDDLFTPEFVPLWHDLAGRAFDFCLMRYQDSARGEFGGWGQTPHDEFCWIRAGADNPAPTHVLGAALWTLSETGNFPWNKIYRTGFLRDNALGCTETRVHNDIELHWSSFLAARRVLVSARIGVLHVVRPEAERLTNLRGETRLQVFDALSPVAGRILRDGRTPAIMSFLRFAAGLLTWVERMIDRDLHIPFDDRKRAFLHTVTSPDIHDRVIRADPVLALRLSLMTVRAHEPVPC